MNRRAFLRLSTIFLFSLVAACTNFPQATGTPPVRVSTQPPASATPPASPTPLPATATQAPSPTATSEPSPTAAPDLPAIEPDNVDRLALHSQIAVGTVLDFAWLPDNQGIVLVNSTGAVTTNQQTFAPSRFLRARTLTQFNLAPDGEHYSAVEANTNVILGELGEVITQTLATLPGAVTSLAFSPDSTRLAMAASDANEVIVWDTRGGVIIGNYTLPFWLSDLAISQDNQILAGVDLPQFSLHFLDPSSGEIQRSLQWTESSSPALYGAILSPDWTRLAWYARGTIQLMDTASGEPGPSLEHEDFINTLAWSPNGDLIASAAAATVDQEFLPVATLWDPVTGEMLHVLPLKTSIAQLKFSPDGTQLGILTTDGGFQVWNIQP